jgi:hypothetical protein
MKIAKAFIFGLSAIRAQEIVDEEVVDDYYEHQEDDEHAKNEQSIMFDQNWKDFDKRTDLMIGELFPTIVNDPDYLANQELIKQQDDDLCAQGRDPNGKKVVCKKNNQDIKTSYLTTARKFKQIKLLTLWLTQDQTWGKYCFYGCYCLPSGVENFTEKGYGIPVDEIDKSCKSFQQCYECAKLGSVSGGISPDETCDGESRKYKYKLVSNTKTGARKIQCS